MKKIKQFKNYIHNIKENNNFRVAINVDDENKSIIEKMGYSEEIRVGVPNLIKGIKTLEENIHGVMTINKNEKEAYYRYFYWHNVDWSGKENSGVATIVSERYKREYSVPLCLKLFLVKKDNQILLCSDTLVYSDSQNEIILAYMNMFKELFGTFDITDDNLNLPIKTKIVNWDILKPGSIDEFIKNLSTRVKSPIKIVKSYERLSDALIKDYNPTKYYGNQGFQGYVAFVYDDRDFVVLENIIYGNATYVLSKNNWQEISKLDKQEVLNKKLYLKKIVHNLNWEKEINHLFVNN